MATFVCAGRVGHYACPGLLVYYIPCLGLADLWYFNNASDGSGHVSVWRYTDSPTLEPFFHKEALSA